MVYNKLLKPVNKKTLQNFKILSCITEQQKHQWPPVTFISCFKHKVAFCPIVTDIKMQNQNSIKKCVKAVLKMLLCVLLAVSGKCYVSKHLINQINSLRNSISRKHYRHLPTTSVNTIVWYSREALHDLTSARLTTDQELMFSSLWEQRCLYNRVSQLKLLWCTLFSVLFILRSSRDEGNILMWANLIWTCQNNIWNQNTAILLRFVLSQILQWSLQKINKCQKGHILGPNTCMFWYLFCC